MVKVLVNGKTFQLFKQIDVSRNMDSLSGEGRIMTSEPVDNQSFITMGDLVQIFFDNIPVITGYAEKISDSESNSSHDISFRIRDKVADLIDSSVPQSLKSKQIEGVKSISDLFQLVIDGLGLTDSIKIIDEVGTLINASDIKAAEIGGTAANYMDEYARKAQVFLNTDGEGNLLLRNQYTKLKTILANVPGFNRNNILNSNISLDNSKRFYKYIVRSNGSFSSTGKTSDNLNNSGEAIDEQIRSTRILEKISESPMTSEECKKAAEEEANIRRSRSFNYTCSVAGFSANGELWNAGKLVTVNDEKKGVVGEFLIKDIGWSFSGSGELTNLTLTYPDAYQVVANPSDLTVKEISAATTYTVVPGDALYKIARNFNISLKMLKQANPQIKNPDFIRPGWEINIPPSNGGAA